MPPLRKGFILTIRIQNKCNVKYIFILCFVPRGLRSILERQDLEVAPFLPFL